MWGPTHLIQGWAKVGLQFWVHETAYSWIVYLLIIVLLIIIILPLPTLYRTGGGGRNSYHLMRGVAKSHCRTCAGQGLQWPSLETIYFTVVFYYWRIKPVCLLFPNALDAYSRILSEPFNTYTSTHNEKEMVFIGSKYFWSGK